MNRAYEMNAKLFHDFHNHIGILRQFLSRGKTKEAVEYLDELQAPVRKMTDTVWTGDENGRLPDQQQGSGSKRQRYSIYSAGGIPKTSNIKKR